MFFAVNFADAIFFMPLSSDLFVLILSNLLDSFRGFLGFYFARRYFTDATIFGFFGVSFAEGIRFHAAAFRSSSDNFVQNIKHLCYHLRFLALTLPCSNFWCHYLREIWSSVDICETAIFEFCGVHLILYKAVLLVPLSSVFLVLILSRAGLFWCHYLRKNWYHFLVEALFVMPLSLDFWC